MSLPVHIVSCAGLGAVNHRSAIVRALLLTAGLSSPAFGQFRDWQTGNGDWSLGGNWTPNGVPMSTETARIGNHANAQNDFVYLDQNDSVAGLQITDGMGLYLDGFQLFVNGNTTISGENFDDPVNYASRLIVAAGAAATEFQTNNLTLSNGGHFDVEAGAIARILGELSTQDGCGIYAEGIIHFHLNGVRAFNNNSIIQVMGPSLTLNQFGTAQIDLDGTSGAGWVHVGAYGTHQFNVVGTSLTDAFSSEIVLSPGHTLNMALSSGWGTDASSEIRAFGGGEDYPDPSIITGGEFTLGGGMSVTGFEGHLRVQAETTIVNSADVLVGETDRMTFENDVDIDGGLFTVSQGGQLHFDADTQLDGGSFTTAGDTFTDGGVVFGGHTVWSGNVTIDGAARQNGNAVVLAHSVIDAIEFDMDGGGGVAPTSWDVNASLVVNAERIDQVSGGSDVGTFHGTMNVSGGILSRFTFNAAEPDDYWVMAGTMNLTGDAVLVPTRVAGSRMHVTGDLDIVSGQVQISSDLRVFTGGSVDIGPASAVLRTSGSTILYPAQYTGFGVIHNAEDADMHLSDGCDFDQIGLRNDGDLTLSVASTLISVDRFVQTAGGVLHVNIDGETPGVEHDLLVVTDGTAQLEGELRVSMPDLGGTQFYPQAGDEFIVIAADDGVVGSFDSDPITIVDDLTFQWAVDYDLFNVVLRLVSVTPACPGDANADGLVNGLDLSVLLSQFGASVEQWSGADLNGDGVINGLDVSVLLANFGDQCFVS